MILDKIVEKKQEFIKNKSFEVEEKEHKKLSFYDFLKKDGLSIIGEIKRASPSKGDINIDVDFIKVTKEYNKVVDAISVLTEEHYFKGSRDFLQSVKTESKIPVLRKDFIIDEREIYESKKIGADAILLIVAILPKEKLKRFLDIANGEGLDCLVEVHNEEELEIAISVGAKIIGINNRNLKTFEVDLAHTVKLRKLIPEGIIVVSESGITNEEDIKKIGNIDAILVGESFMKSDDISALAKELKNAKEN